MITTSVLLIAASLLVAQVVVEEPTAVLPAVEEWVELPIELPNPPTDEFGWHFDEYVSRFQIDPERYKRGWFRIESRRLIAPPDAVNLAYEKPVTSSDRFPVFGDMNLVTDGDKEALDGRYVELAPGKQHVTIDLGEPRLIYAVAVWHYQIAAEVQADIVIQMSDDAAFEEAVTIFNNDRDNSLGFGEGEGFDYVETSVGEVFADARTEGDRWVMNAPLGTARYVRLWSNGSNGNPENANFYSEVEVWGRASE